MTDAPPRPAVSIVIPSYHHEQFIEAAVDSCFGQTLQDIEIVVVDDGSKDRSLNYLRSVHAPFFKLIEQENAGAHVAINVGLNAARGRKLAVLNSDDVFSPTRLAEISAAMDEAGAAFACSWLRQIDADGAPGPIKKGWHDQLPSWLRGTAEVNSDNAFLHNLARSNFVSTTSNMVFSRELFEEIGGMRNLRFAHDWDFAFRACLAGEPLMVEQPLLSYRTHATNTIRTHRAWMMFEVLWCLALYLPEVATRLGSALPVRDGQVYPDFDLGENRDAYSRIYAFIHADPEDAPQTAAERLLDDTQLRAPFIEAIR